MSEIITLNGHQMMREYDYCDRLIYDHNGNRTDKTGSTWMMDGHRQESIGFKYDRKNQLVEERYGDETIRYIMIRQETGSGRRVIRRSLILRIIKRIN